MLLSFLSAKTQKNLQDVTIRNLSYCINVMVIFFEVYLSNVWLYSLPLWFSGGYLSFTLHKRISVQVGDAKYIKLFLITSSLCFLWCFPAMINFNWFSYVAQTWRLNCFECFLTDVRHTTGCVMLSTFIALFSGNMAGWTWVTLLCPREKLEN